ncbi:ketosteroid isomerase-like protein [Saccharopolyspora lacisalsi]|uniref:Ketosteroid isomerase-like protein n=1 Tax=Halosaccharopolyspora lacisalsi TaxID=1000566 RepID=A0A839DQI9_9PSEU|nr:nuclear transport factor 2 family protein [Halosaccharopolyspora lacisalsi]MBA8823774.1 ketosteroid isomerase-like protein [Halosaccharopolyspora lacisalsi]
MSRHQQIIRTYTSGFATCDLARILSCVSDDLVWEFNGQQVGQGKAAFEEQMARDLASGAAEVTIERFVEQGDAVVALNRGRFVPHGESEGMPFVSAEAYTFVDDKISRIQTFQPMN